MKEWSEPSARNGGSATTRPEGRDPTEDLGDEDVVLEDVLVEDVSIDGMCGVY